jgi:nickel transport protein
MNLKLGGQLVNALKRFSSKGPRMFAVCMVAVIGTCLLTVQAQAHKVNVFAYVEGDRVVVEAYFSANVKARDCLVTVLDEKGKKLHEGKTDQNGTYSFKLADLSALSDGLKIALDVGEGHKAEYTLSASDLPSSSKKDEPAKEQPQKNEPPKNQSLNSPQTPVTGSTQVVDQAALTAALDTVLDKKLEPIVRMLGKQEKLLLEEKYGGPKLHDIIGGIGWIMGLAGLTAFFLGRKQSAKRSSD